MNEAREQPADGGQAMPAEKSEIESPSGAAETTAAATAAAEDPSVEDDGKQAGDQSSAEIMIGLEDESGEQKPVEIDETDEALAGEAEEEETPEEALAQQGRRVSITERVLKSKNSEQQMQTLTKSAEDRKRELQELLSEHAQLVHQVSSLEEVTSPSADKENATFDPPAVTTDSPDLAMEGQQQKAVLEDAA